jgi:hypothetical protein
MNMIAKTLAAAALAAPLVLVSGCNTLTGGSSSGSSAASQEDADVNPELKQDSPEFFSKSGATGCAVGALAGVLACLLSNSDNKGVCAVAAGVGGCAVGMSANYLLDKVRADYHNTEDQLNATKAAVQENIDKTAKLRDVSSKTLKEDQAAVKQLNADYEKGQATADQLKAKDKELAANIKFLSKKKAEAEIKLKEAQTARDGVVADAGGEDSLTADRKKSVAELDKQINELKTTIDEVNSNIIAYSDSRNSLAVNKNV